MDRATPGGAETSLTPVDGAPDGVVADVSLGPDRPACLHEADAVRRALLQVAGDLGIRVLGTSVDTSN